MQKLFSDIDNYLSAEDRLAFRVRLDAAHPVYAGHFPGNPVVPGVIQCEMMAQSACVLLASGAAEGCTPMFTSLDKVKFRGQVKPGDTLETECEITRQRGNFYFAKGKGSVNGKVCVSAEFSFALVKSE